MAEKLTKSDYVPGKGMQARTAHSTMNAPTQEPGESWESYKARVAEHKTMMAAPKPEPEPATMSLGQVAKGEAQRRALAK